MLATMTAREFEEWRAYYTIEPFFADRLEWLIAQLTALLANVNRDSKKRGEPFTPRDFVLDTRSEKERQLADAKRLQAKVYFDQLVAEARARRRRASASGDKSQK